MAGTVSLLPVASLAAAGPSNYDPQAYHYYYYYYYQFLFHASTQGASEGPMSGLCHPPPSVAAANAHEEIAPVATSDDAPKLVVNLGPVPLDGKTGGRERLQ